MYRLYIILFLAIASSVFAVDSSQSILQAKNITDTAITVSWMPVPGATQYKIFYDESALLDPGDTRLLLDTDFMTSLQGEISKLSPWTDFTVIVHGYTTEWKDIGTTLPLHVRTYTSQPLMNLVHDPLVSDSMTLELGFSRPVDLEKIQLSLQNTSTKKWVPLWDITSSPSDLRIIFIKFKNPLEMNTVHELTMQKVVSLDWVELPSENRIPLKIVYSGDLPSLDSHSSVVPYDTVREALPDVPEFSEPVPINALPTTWPEWLIIYLMISLFILLSYKKISKSS